MAGILLCDDSKIILALLERKLKKSGFEIVGMAEDGDACLKLFRDTRPDLVLLDITMPNKDGRECLVDIIKIDPSAKVIMVSALQDKEVVESCMKSGAQGFISKAHLSRDEE